MPPKPNKKKVKIAKVKEEKTVTISSSNLDRIYDMKIHDVETVISILLCPEQAVMLRALCTIDCFIAKDEPNNLNIAMKHNLIEILLNIVTRPDLKVSNFKMILKLLNKFLKYDTYLNMMEKKLDDLEFFIQVFGESNDMALIDLIFNLMYRLCELSKFIERFCQPDTIEKVFQIFMTQNDLILTEKCIMTLYRIISCPSVQQYLCHMQEFQVGVLATLVTNNYVQPLIMKIFLELSKLSLNCIHLAISDSKTLEKLMTLLQETKWQALQNDVLEIIHNCLENHKYHLQLVASKEFLQFLELSFDSEDHALACITLMVEFSESLSARQAMYDLRIIEELPMFYKFKCSFINIKICECLAALCLSCFISEDSMANLYIRELGKMINLKRLPWIPYRQAALYPLYVFLNANNGLVQHYKENNILKNLKEALINRDNLDKIYFEYVIKIYFILLSKNSENYQYLLNRNIFSFLIEKVKSYFSSNANNYDLFPFMDVMALILTIPKYRRWFLEMDMQNYFNEYLKQYKHNIHRTILEFLNNIMKYPDIAKALVKTRMTSVLKKIIAGEPDPKKALCNALKESLYESDLSIKFHETHELTPSDIIKTTFVASLGPTPPYFPFGSLPEVDKLSATYTMVVVSIDPDGQCASGTDTSFESCVNNYMANDERLDKHVKQILETLKDEELERLTPRKIERIANFVCDILSANTININSKLIEHRFELKKRLNSNFLPLGMIHVGGLLERALLFKVIADHCGVPCSLTRSSHCEGIVWNEIPINCKHKISIDDEPVHHNSVQLSALSNSASTFVTEEIENEVVVKIKDTGNIKDAENYNTKFTDFDVTKVGKVSRASKLSRASKASKGSKLSRVSRVSKMIKMPKAVRLSVTVPDEKRKARRTLNDLKKELHPDLDRFHRQTVQNFKRDEARSDTSVDMDDYDSPESNVCIRNCIVDLKENFGALYPVNSKEGFIYRRQLFHEDDDYIKMQFIMAREHFSDLFQF